MSKFLNAKRIEIFVIVVVIAAAGVVYAFTRTPSVSAPSTTTTQTSQQPVTYVSYDGQDGRNALDLLKVFHQVETKDTSFGPQVMGIDGNHPDETNSYWAFYINGKLADKGADQIVTTNSDKIEWKVEGF